VNFTEKLNAISNVTSSCEARNGRTDMIYNLQQLTKRPPQWNARAPQLWQVQQECAEEEAKTLAPGPAARDCPGQEVQVLSGEGAPHEGSTARC